MGVTDKPRKERVEYRTCEPEIIKLIELGRWRTGMAFPLSLMVVWRLMHPAPGRKGV